MGSVTSKRNSFHVAVEVVNNGDYARFTINDILGRLDCPAEPLLVYLRSLFHAYTSFVVPDCLTGRTGSEEALQSLKSGISQPWQPINVRLFEILTSIAALTPRRDFYPEDIKVMQKVFWDARLTTTIQHDEFRPVVEAICKKSEQLSKFSFQKTEVRSLELVGESHLQHRSYSRRRLYQRPNPDPDEQQADLDLPYDSRDRCRFSKERRNVFESGTLLRNCSSEMPVTRDLAGILQSWPTIGGYDRLYDKVLLSDHLAVDFSREWGSLVNFCCASEAKDKYRLMFLFALMSFRNDVNMDVVRTFIAFSVWEDLKSLGFPKWSAYIQFRHNQIPYNDYLLQFIKPYRVPYAGDERSILKSLIGSKLRRKCEAAELEHEQRTENDCKALAQVLLDQWPCLEPKIEEFWRPASVNSDLALMAVLPEWQRLYQNLDFSRHVQQLQHVLDCHRTERKVELHSIDLVDQEVRPTRSRGGEFPGLSRNLLRKAGLKSSEELRSALSINDTTRITHKGNENSLAMAQNEGLPHSLQEPVQGKLTVSSMSCEMQELENIIDCITGTQSVRQHYRQDMMQSLNNLKMLKSAPKRDEKPIHMAKLSADILKTRQAIEKQYDQLCEAFEQSDSRVLWLQEGCLWPSITTITLLEQLRYISASIFENLIVYALIITTLQRFMRMKDAYQKGNIQRIREEQENAGHCNWRPIEHPDWLLLEIDANILIRYDQVEVALATISPASGSNSVLHMNMGQGEFYFHYINLRGLSEISIRTHS